MGESNGILYALQQNGKVKIGITSVGMARRLANYKTHSPEKTEILFEISFPHIEDARYCEANLCACLLSHRIRGEWFEPHPDVFALLSALAINPQKMRDEIAARATQIRSYYEESNPKLKKFKTPTRQKRRRKSYVFECRECHAFIARAEPPIIAYTDLPDSEIIAPLCNQCAKLLPLAYTLSHLKV